MQNGPRWFEHNSKFRYILASALFANGTEVEFVDFEWSGSNSFSERIKAAHRLWELIDLELDKNDNGKLCLIGHSHGGCVIGRSLFSC